jgi:hypothetical protein
VLQVLRMLRQLLHWAHLQHPDRAWTAAGQLSRLRDDLDGLVGDHTFEKVVRTPSGTS